jgi:hypothetical protein
VRLKMRRIVYVLLLVSFSFAFIAVSAQTVTSKILKGSSMANPDSQPLVQLVKARKLMDVQELTVFKNKIRLHIIDDTGAPAKEKTVEPAALRTFIEKLEVYKRLSKPLSFAEIKKFDQKKSALPIEHQIFLRENESDSSPLVRYHFDADNKEMVDVWGQLWRLSMDLLKD